MSYPLHHRLTALRTLVCALLFGLVGALLSPPPAAGHAFISESDPAANAILPSSPDIATLVFTERLERSYSKAELYDQAGDLVPGTSFREGADEYEMIVDLPPNLTNGTYSILWRTLSLDDGHTGLGYIPFTIGTGADVQSFVPPAAAAVSTGPPEWMRMGARWLSYLGLAATIAVWPIWLFVLRPGIAPAWQIGPTLTRRVRGVAVAAVIVALLGSIAMLLVQAAGLAGPSGLIDGLTITLSETRFGTIWLLRVGLILVYAASLFAVAWWWPWRRLPAAVLPLFLGATLPVTYSAMAHAAAQTVGSETAIAADALHLYSASIWAGGLIILVAALVPTLRDLTAVGRQVVLTDLIPRFSRIALIAWAVMILTGLYAAWLQVGNLTALSATPYGESLIVKLALIVPLLGLGAFNLLVATRRVAASADEGSANRWSRRFSLAIVAETVLVVLVLLVVGLLVGQPPAREVITRDAERITIPLLADDQQATLYITPGATGPNHYQLALGSGHDHATGRGTAPVRALLRIELPERETGVKEIDLLPAPGGAYEAHGSELSIEGTWNIEVIVRQQGQADWRTSVTQAIALTPPVADVPPPPPRFGPAGVAGLLLLVAGLAGLILAATGKAGMIRKEAAGLGTVALALGVVLVAQARLSPDELLASANPVPVIPVDQAAVVRGEPLFAANCATCHGQYGRGDGPAAAGLEPPPADLTAFHALAHPDDVYQYWIENGIPGSAMPAFAGELSPEQIRDVVVYIRDLQNDVAVARDAPGAEGCLIEPRSLDGMAGVSATPGAGPPPTPAAVTEQAVAPAVLDGLTNTVRELVACSNAGDSLRRLALYSDNRIRLSYPNGPTPALARMAEAPLPVPELERVALLNLDEARMMADGRASARVTIDNPLLHSHSLATPGVNPQEDQARLIFVEQDGRWLIDGFLE
ncbi:MAG: CopD family protein [Chloroflexota bacterium]|nr:CopD family protein [Chloroflexota bacterium]